MSWLYQVHKFYLYVQLLSSLLKILFPFNLIKAVQWHLFSSNWEILLNIWAGNRKANFVKFSAFNKFKNGYQQSTSKAPKTKKMHNKYPILKKDFENLVFMEFVYFFNPQNQV